MSGAGAAHAQAKDACEKAGTAFGHDLVLWKTGGNTAILALPPMALAHHSLRPDSLPLLFSGGLLLSSLAGAVCTNLIHRWAHMPRPPGPARWLQGRGLILSPERHARHHRRPFDRAYCITTGWLNAPMDRLGVWKAVERWLGRAARQDPR